MVAEPSSTTTMTTGPRHQFSFRTIGQRHQNQNQDQLRSVATTRNRHSWATIRIRQLRLNNCLGSSRLHYHLHSSSAFSKHSIDMIARARAGTGAVATEQQRPQQQQRQPPQLPREDGRSTAEGPRPTSIFTQPTPLPQQPPPTAAANRLGGLLRPPRGHQRQLGKDIRCRTTPRWPLGRPPRGNNIRTSWMASESGSATTNSYNNNDEEGKLFNKKFATKIGRTTLLNNTTWQPENGQWGAQHRECPQRPANHMQINIINDEDLDKKFDNKIWKNFCNNILDNRVRRQQCVQHQANNRQEDIENNIANNELFNNSLLTQIVPQRRLWQQPRQRKMEQQHREEHRQQEEHWMRSSTTLTTRSRRTSSPKTAEKEIEWDDHCDNNSE